MRYSIIFLILVVTTLSLAEKHRTLERKIATTPAQRIELDGISGSDIRLKSWSNNEIAVKLRVSISSSDEEYEEEYISSAKITESSTSTSIRLTFDATDRKEKKGFSLLELFKSFYVEKKISGEIYVPKANPLSTDMRYGSLTLEDMEGELYLEGVSNSLSLRNCTSVKKIENNYGATVIENSGGDLQLSGTSSTVSISDFNGRVRVNADYSTVTMSKIKQSVHIQDKSGTIKLDDVTGDVALDADYSKITIKNIKGFAEINSTSATIKAYTVDGIHVSANYSDVDIGGVSGTAGKQIIIKGQSGSLTLEDAIGNVKIDNPYSNIDLKNIKGDITLSSKSSSVSAVGIAGDWNSRTEYCSVKLRKLAAKNITMTNKSETIDLRLAVAPDTLSIENEYGNVSVKMPTGFSGAVDLDAQYGTIQTTFPLKQKSRSSTEYATGKIGVGNGSIIIETKSGDIELTEE